MGPDLEAAVGGGAAGLMLFVKFHATVYEMAQISTKAATKERMGSVGQRQPIVERFDRKTLATSGFMDNTKHTIETPLASIL
jgi:hypothetical protein